MVAKSGNTSDKRASKGMTSDEPVSSKRRQNPGRRNRGGKILDSDLGITCHFCKQKTVEKHVYCRDCGDAFCRSCLHLRNGEDLFIERAYTKWLCPRCRGGCGKGCRNCCNCAYCRRKQNLNPAKIIYSQLQAHGFDNAHDYLVHLETQESPEKIMARKLGKEWCQTVVKKFKLAENTDVKHENVVKNFKVAENTDVKHESILKKFKLAEKTDTVKYESVLKKSKLAEYTQVKHESDSEEYLNPEDNHTDFSSMKDTRKGSSCSKNDGLPQIFRVELQKRLLEPFVDEEFDSKWEMFVSRKCSGSSYIDCYPDFWDKLGSATSKEEKLKLLRGFFYWLERASSPGAFRPWLDIENDDECMEIGADCEIRAVVLDFDNITSDIKPNINQLPKATHRYVKQEE